MSRSPKYTTARLGTEAERRLQEQRRQREEERVRKREAAYQHRLAGERSRLQQRITAQRVRIAGLMDAARNTGVVGPDLGTVLHATEAAVRKATDDPSLATVDRQLSGIDQQLDALSTRIAGEEAKREQRTAVQTLMALLDAVSDRERLDPQGARDVARLLAAAEHVLGHGPAFEAAHHAARDGIGAHLRRARTRAMELADLRRRAERAAAVLADVLNEVRTAGAELRGAPETEAALKQHAEDLAAGRVERAVDAIPTLERAAHKLSGSLDVWQNGLERTRQIVEAAAAALPRAGLHITPGSYQREGDTIRFQASRGDGSPIGISITSHGEQDAHIRYHAAGADFVIDQSDGTATCDRTEEILERLHQELAAEGVETGELLWEGKPSRPDRIRQVIQQDVRPDESGAR